MVHHEVHLEGLLVSHPRFRWGPLLVTSCPQSPSFPRCWPDWGEMGLLSAVVWGSRERA